MLMRRQMSHEKDVAGPRKLLRVASTGEHEAHHWPQPSGFDKQLFQPRLPVGGKRPDVGEVGAERLFRAPRSVSRRIDMAVERSRPPGAELPGQLVQGFTPGI